MSALQDEVAVGVRRYGGFEHARDIRLLRQVDVLADTRTPRVAQRGQRRQRARGGGHHGALVAEDFQRRQVYFGMRCGTQARPTAGIGDDQLCRTVVPVGTRNTEGRDRQHHQVRMLRLEDIRIEAEGVGAQSRVVVHQDVRPCDQGFQILASGSAPKIEADPALVHVQRQE